MKPDCKLDISNIENLSIKGINFKEISLLLASLFIEHTCEN